MLLRPLVVSWFPRLAWFTRLTSFPRFARLSRLASFPRFPRLTGLLITPFVPATLRLCTRLTLCMRVIIMGVRVVLLSLVLMALAALA